MTRQLDVGAVVRKVFDIYVGQANVLMPAAAVVFVFSELIAGLLISERSAGLELLAALIVLVATTLFTGMVVELVADVRDGRRDARPAQLLRAVTPVLWPLIGVGLVAGVGVVLGFIFFVIPGLILLTIWSLAAPVMVLERPRVFAALARSRDLVRGNGMRVFGVIVLLVLVVRVIGYAIDAVAESAGSGAGIVARVVVGVLTAPLPALAAAVLYFELGGRMPARDRVTPVEANPFGET
jgi:hypothetical protein